ncbi:hypothetical protein TNCV_974141 [Trichonephila clavipes]|nr:hypothetical protein TNCV_974141 [Trichonephila clavipes]
MYSAFAAWGYFKLPSSHKSSREVGGERKRSGRPLITAPRVLSLKIEVETSQIVLSNCVVLKATANDRRTTYPFAVMNFVGLELAFDNEVALVTTTKLRSEEIRKSKKEAIDNGPLNFNNRQTRDKFLI